MYFITKDINNTITGVYDGSMDYVHRITGAPIKGAKTIPDDTIEISEMCLEKLQSTGLGGIAVWNEVNSCVDVATTLTPEQKKVKLFYGRRQKALDEEVIRIGSLTEAELDTELGAL